MSKDKESSDQEGDVVDRKSDQDQPDLKSTEWTIPEDPRGSGGVYGRNMGFRFFDDNYEIICNLQTLVARPSK